MKILRTAFAIAMLCSISVLLLSCASNSNAASSTENQTVTVQRGNLTIDITASGNLALSQTQDLAFGAAGTIEEVTVEEGDTIEEGQVLAKLDASEWEDQLRTLERAVTSAKLSLLQKQIDLQTAENNLNDIDEVAEAQDAVDTAEYDLEIAEAMTKLRWETAPAELDYWRNQVTIYQQVLADAEDELDEILSGSSATLTDDVALEVAQRQLRVELAQGQMEDAEGAVEDAQKALDEAMSTSPDITAPFAGFITKVNVEGGDEVTKGTVAVTIADPDKFEAEILVSEMDISQVELGNEGYVQADALQGLSLPAKVTHISPTATIQSGVVNYKVKVEVQSLEELTKEREQARQELTEPVTEGELPERLQQAVDEGRLTQEQSEQMMEQMQQFQTGQQGQLSTTTPTDVQLREGMTITVALIINQKNDVILVPNGAITTQGQQAYVQVMSTDGTIERRTITAGISNWQYTEVTDGLSEGENVIVPQGTAAATSTTTQQGPPEGGMFIPGMGRP